MTRHRHTLSSVIRIAAAIAAAIIAAVAVSPAAAQDSDWRTVENPYQEDIEYIIGTTHQPGVAVDGVRWRSFRIEAPEGGLLVDGETVDAELTVEFENRLSTSAKILVILLLEDGDGNPLDRIEVKQFKVAGGRIKEKTQAARLSGTVVKSAQRVYCFFEVME